MTISPVLPLCCDKDGVDDGKLEAVGGDVVEVALHPWSVNCMAIAVAPTIIAVLISIK